ncbi:MAG: tripartite tricarboxylate transporter permease [Pseudorhodoplanes sp.]
MFDAFFTAAIQILLDPYALALVVAATAAGIVLGALPGISSTMSLAILLPFSFAMGSTHAMLFLMGIFYGSVYGGSISAILLNIPGTPGSMVTQLDGHPMARSGRAGEALTFAIIASTIGGVLGLVALVVFAPLLAQAALYFQSPEFAAMMLFGLTMLAYASPGSTYLGLVGGVIGLIMGTVGLDAVSNASRLDFGVPELQAGINLIPVVVGAFGLAEVMRTLEQRELAGDMVRNIGRLWPGWLAVLRTAGTAARSSLIGILVGIIPAAGSAIAVSIAYAQEKRMFEGRETFGDGNPRGIMAAEAGNNSCVGGALIPMMTLGIPGDTMTAVLVGALLIHGLRPGPNLFEQHPDFVGIVYVALALTIVATVLLAFVGIRLFVRLLTLPRRTLVVAIVLLCVVGSYSVQNSLFDVTVMIVSGVGAYFLSKAGLPPAPILFGLVLGPLLEENVRRTLVVHQSWTIFFERPLSLTLIVISIFTLAYPLITSFRHR